MFPIVPMPTGSPVLRSYPKDLMTFTFDKKIVTTSVKRPRFDAARVSRIEPVPQGCLASTATTGQPLFNPFTLKVIEIFKR